MIRGRAGEAPRDARLRRAVRRERDDHVRAGRDVLGDCLVEPGGSLEHVEALGAERRGARLAPDVRDDREATLAREPRDGGACVTATEDENAIRFIDREDTSVAEAAGAREIVRDRALAELLRGALPAADVADEACMAPSLGSGAGP